jgi:hypothetical protein
VRDRTDVGAEEKIRFTSSILSKCARRTKSLDALLTLTCAGRRAIARPWALHGSQHFPMPFDRPVLLMKSSVTLTNGPTMPYSPSSEEIRVLLQKLMEHADLLIGLATAIQIPPALPPAKASQAKIAASPPAWFIPNSDSYSDYKDRLD